jgi:hypothetical protein
MITIEQLNSIKKRNLEENFKTVLKDLEANNYINYNFNLNMFHKSFDYCMQLVKNFNNTYNKCVHTNAQRHNLKKTTIKLTEHSKHRIIQRMEHSYGNPFSNYNSFLDVCKAARYKGIPINDKLTLKMLDDNKTLYKYLNSMRDNTKSSLKKLYGNYLFIFDGEKNRTLKTIHFIPNYYVLNDIIEAEQIPEECSLDKIFLF